MSNFLDDLKNSLEKGEFNSDAAKKINDIDKLADEKMNADAEELVKQRLENAGIKTISEEEIMGVKTEYEEKMEKLKYFDLVLKQRATLENMDNMIQLSIQDMQQFIMTLEAQFDVNDNRHVELYKDIEKIKNKYSNI